ncbi:MAG: aminotransferase class I/II-fold pyridoxal phosphate-dependent enzyme [Coriobacteriales bacterium]|nr:aminotransferase class I/II-fold pyridoxal phosphate-dependent enzyme [Coriobacteriales bacterium]
MTYDFETIIDRHGHDSLAVDGLSETGGFAPARPREGFDSLPMWVADMGFATAPSVTAAMRERLEHPVFGYYAPSDAYFEAIVSWQKDCNAVQGLEPTHIGYENGVLGGVVSALGTLCSRGDNVLVHSPTYVGFTMALTNNGYHLVHSPLVRDEDGVWRMDFEDMERRIRENHIHAAVFCSPHNPCGRAWERWEIERAMELFERYDVWVVSDEIWSDLMLDGHVHIPTQSVSDWARMHTAAFYAPSKTFNLAGLVGSYHIVYNSWLRERMDKESSLSHYNSQNVLSMHALLGAYTAEGRAWCDELREVLSNNARYFYEQVSQFPGVELARPEATYVLLLNCKNWCEEHGVSNDELVRRGWDVGVTWHDGRLFECPWCVRVNVAIPHTQIVEACERLARYVFV